MEVVEGVEGGYRRRGDSLVEAAATRSVGIAEPSRDNVEQICHKGEDSHSREDCAYLSRE